MVVFTLVEDGNVPQFGQNLAHTL